LAGHAERLEALADAAGTKTIVVDEVQRLHEQIIDLL